MFESISLDDLQGITGGKSDAKLPGCVRDRKDPRHPDRGHNTGITGGMNVTNNEVKRKPHNTGITGGMDVPNNDVP